MKFRFLDKQTMLAINKIHMKPRQNSHETKINSPCLLETKFTDHCCNIYMAGTKKQHQNIYRPLLQHLHITSPVLPKNESSKFYRSLDYPSSLQFKLPTEHN